MDGIIVIFTKELKNRAERLLEDYRRAGWRLTIAESCTGGLIAGCLTAIPGASDVVECGFITYSDAAKAEVLAVPQELIERLGAVSAEVAEAMVQGALARSQADLAVSATGIAGPDGGTADKPVGLVYLAIGFRGSAPRSQRYLFSGDRDGVRLAAVEAALDLLAAQLSEQEQAATVHPSHSFNV